MGKKKLEFRLSHEQLRHLELVAEEFALPSRTAALVFCLNRDRKANPSKGRDEAERDDSL